MLQPKGPSSDPDFRRGEWSSEIVHHYFQRERRTWEGDRRVRVEERFDETWQRIDPIDKDIVGKASISNLRQGAPPWIRDVLLYLVSGDGRRVMQWQSGDLEQQAQDRKGRLHSQYLTPVMSKAIVHLTTTSELFKQVDARRLTLLRADEHSRVAQGFFVEKHGKTVEVKRADGTTFSAEVLRVITDARPANAHCADESSFPMFTLNALLQTVSNVSHAASNRGEFYAVCADERHFYFQLPLPSEMQPLFMLQTSANVVHVPTALPMGFCLAPLIGQSVSWAVVLGGGDGLPAATVPGSAMPAWLPFRDQPGGVFVLIDNILVITADKKVAAAWAQRIMDRADHAKIALKVPAGTARDQRVTVATIRRGDADTTFEFSGIRFYFDCWHTIKRERTIEPGGGTTLSHRQVSALLGEILWDLRVRQVAVLDYPDVLDVYQAVVPATVHDWDAPCELAATQRQTLVERTAAARENRMAQRLPEWHAGCFELYAVDACRDEYRQQSAIVHLAEEGGQLRLRWRKRSGLSFDYIGETELSAIVDAVRDAVSAPREAQEPLSLIIAATDSLVAKGWVERGYSERPAAQKLLRELAEILGSVRLACPYVRSAENVADAPSRTETSDGDMSVIDATCAKQSWAVLQGEIASTFLDATTRGQGRVRRPRTKPDVASGTEST
jgi:hypothetical protein